MTVARTGDVGVAFARRVRVSLAALAFGASIGGTVVAVAADPGAPRRNGDADRLGATRLFFTAGQRASGDGRSGDASPDGGDATSPDAAAASPGRPDAARPRRSPDAASIASTAPTPAPSTPAPSPRFQAMLTVDDHVRVVLGDRPCRTADASDRLHCDTLPDGVRELSVAPDGRRLRVTWTDGRRGTFAVGAVLRP